MAEIVWTREALHDIDAIAGFHSRTSRSYTSALVTRLYDAVGVLEAHPRLGRKVPEIDHDAVRELIVQGFRSIYQLQRNRIEILAVLHSRQDLRKKFRKRDQH